MQSGQRDELAAVEGEPDDTVPPSGRFETVVAAATQPSTKMNGTHSEPAYRLQLFGGPIVTGPDGPVKLSPRQAQLLSLVYGHEARPLSRRQAIWLLWEKDDNKEARHSLRELLYKVKERLGFRAILTPDPESLVPDLGALSSDLVGFRECVSAQRLVSAVEVIVRGFLSGLRNSPGAELEDWVEAKQIRLRHDLWTAAAKLWDQAHAANSWTRCLDASETLYTLDPKSEIAVQKIVEARAMTGSPEASEAAYSMFLEQLGATAQPSTKIVQLIERVRDLGNTKIAPHTERPTADRRPFVGREAQLRLGQDFIARVQDGGFEFALISGEAGLGKTRFLQEVTALAQLQGVRCLTAALVESEAVLPLNPLIDAFAHPDVCTAIQELENPWKAVLAGLLPAGVTGDQDAPVPAIGDDRVNRRLFDAIALLLRHMASDRPTILFMDNIQWIDNTTSSALHFAQRRWREGGFGVLATLRTDPSGRTNDVVTPGSGIVTTGIPLTPLSEEEAVRLVQGVLGSQTSGIPLLEVTAMGGGNPFYLTELARAHKEGRLSLPTKVNGGGLIPISLRELFEARLSPLSADALLAVESLAVWARPTRLRELGKAADLPDHALLTAVEELENKGLLRVEDGRVSVIHELFRKTLYDRLSCARRAFFHRAIGEYLDKNEAGTPPGELALHFARAGEATSAVKFARLASHEAATKGALPEACRFLQVAIDNAPIGQTRAVLTADLGLMLSKSRDISRAAPVLETAALRLRRFGLIDRAREMETLRVEALSELGVVPSSELLDRLYSILSEAKNQSDWTGVATALDTLLHLLHRTGDVGKMRSALEEAEVCVREGDPRAQCIAGSVLALGVLYGDPVRALSASRNAVRISTSEGLVDLLLNAQNRLVVVLLYRGMLNLPEGARLIQQATEASEASGDRLQRFSLEANLGVFLLDSGEPDRARVALDRSAEILHGAEASTYHLNLLYNLGELALQERDYSLARNHFTEAEARLDHNAPDYMRWLVNAGLGICALESGSLSEARLRESDSGPTQGPWYFDPTLLIDFRVRYLTRRGEAEAALIMVESCTSGLRDRLTQAWLKLKTLEGQLARRLGKDNVILRLSNPIAVAAALRLHARTKILRALTES